MHLQEELLVGDMHLQQGLLVGGIHLVEEGMRLRQGHLEVGNLVRQGIL